MHVAYERHTATPESSGNGTALPNSGVRWQSPGQLQRPAPRQVLQPTLQHQDHPLCLEASQVPQVPASMRQSDKLCGPVVALCCSASNIVLETEQAVQGSLTDVYPWQLSATGSTARDGWGTG